MLARQLGRTLGELVRTMPSREFEMHWQQYRAGLWGEARDDRRMAALAAATANYAGRATDATPFHFLHLIDAKPPVAESPADLFGKP